MASMRSEPLSRPSCRLTTISAAFASVILCFVVLQQSENCLLPQHLSALVKYFGSQIAGLDSFREDVASASGSYSLVSLCISDDGSATEAILRLSTESLPEYGPSVKELRLRARYHGKGGLQVHITDADQARWEVPQRLVPRQEFPDLICTPQPSTADLHEFSWDTTSLLKFTLRKDPFSFVVTRRSTGEVLFDTSASPLVFKDQYLEISTQLPPGAALYGLGESTRPDGLRLRSNRTFTLWTVDTSASGANVDLYGAHPFYMDVRKGGLAHGVLLLNSNGMDVTLGERSLTYRVIGGVFDFYFFAGPEPLTVVHQLTDVIGKPAAMPYWALGWHQCKWGYKSVAELREVVANYTQAGLPLDTIWSDIDYMDQYRDFVLDPVNFNPNELRGFVEELHRRGQHWVPIVDPGIKVEAGYLPYERGLTAGIFVRDPTGQPYLGQVWPGPTHFPDFALHPNIEDYWRKELEAFHKVAPFDGLWIDMNEVSNFCTGVVCRLPETCPHEFGCCLDCNNANATRYDNPPYRINVGGSHLELGFHSEPMSAHHYGGQLAYNVHNLYGLAEGKTTAAALRAVTGKRAFVLSRSTFPGSGAHTAHWTGDNTATWQDLRYSIASVLNMGLFGVPAVGADICGFAGNTTEELCLRWVQLGAFYPFARSHNVIGAAPQEPYRWGGVAEAARKALGLRYRLLPVLYTLAFQAHREGSPIARPLFFNFPEDAQALSIDQQFLLGRFLLISPVLKPGVTAVDAYFPPGVWYSIGDLSRVVSSKGGCNKTLSAPLNGAPNVHVFEGGVLPLQQGGMTVPEARKTPFELLVTFGEVEKETVRAEGLLYLDSGDDLEMGLFPGKATMVSFQAALSRDGSGWLRSSVVLEQFAKEEGYVIDRITLLGVMEEPGSVTLSGAPLGKEARVEYSRELRRVVVLNLGLSMSETVVLHWGPKEALREAGLSLPSKLAVS